MKRATSLLAASVLSIVPFTLAQDLQNQPTPPLTSDILGPELIVWSQFQKPQPVPQPLPDPPEQQQGKSSPTPNPSDKQPDVQTFTGRITMDGGKYVLKMANDNTYQLDDQEKAKQYENKDVKLVGTVDENNHSVRIISIQLIS